MWERWRQRRWLNSKRRKVLTIQNEVENEMRDAEIQFNKIESGFLNFTSQFHTSKRWFAEVMQKPTYDNVTRSIGFNKSLLNLLEEQKDQDIKLEQVFKIIEHNLRKTTKILERIKGELGLKRK